MKKFRKISALMLALVLVCTLAATAFAATSRAVEEVTSGGSTVYESGTIDKLSVSGAVNVNEGERMDSFKIVIDYSYIQVGTTSTIIQDSYQTTAYEARSHSGSKTLNGFTCKNMVHATYSFRVGIPSEGNFNSTPFTLYYS